MSTMYDKAAKKNWFYNTNTYKDMNDINQSTLQDA